MTQQQPAASDSAASAAERSGLRGGRRWWLVAGAALVALVIVGLVTSPLTAGATAHDGGDRVAGAGKTIIEGGTGGATPSPVTTLVAFHAGPQGGDFECLALAPPSATGPGSGEFTVNAMYVTGKVTSMDVLGHTATLHGTATVTGLGAGQAQPFTVQVTRGGPGATLKLDVSGLTFHEILVDGHFNVR
jgi:hypothetical protein